MEKRIGEGVRLSEVLRTSADGGEGMVLSERANHSAELSQIIFGGADADQSAVFLHHVDARTAVRRIDHDV